MHIDTFTMAKHKRKRNGCPGHDIHFFSLKEFFSHDMHVHICVAINFWTETGQYIANDNSEAWESRCHLLLLACTDGACGSLQPKNIPKCILNRHG